MPLRKKQRRKRRRRRSICEIGLRKLLRTNGKIVGSFFFFRKFNEKPNENNNINLSLEKTYFRKEK